MQTSSVIVCTSFENNSRRKQELAMRPAADTLYRGVFGGQVEIERFEATQNFVLDREHAIDVRLRVPSGLILLGQEKFLSHVYAKFASVTVEYLQNSATGEHGDWFKLAPQFYFVGYMTEDAGAFKPWILLDWSRVVLATHEGRVKWIDNKNKDGHARASFRYCAMRSFPKECVIDGNYQAALSRSSLINAF